MLICCLPVRADKLLRALLYVDIASFVADIVLDLFLGNLLEKIFGLVSNILYIPVLLVVAFFVLKRKSIKRKLFLFWILLRTLVLLGDAGVEVISWIIFDFIVKIRFMFIIRVVFDVFNIYYNLKLHVICKGESSEELEYLFTGKSKIEETTDKFLINKSDFK